MQLAKKRGKGGRPREEGQRYPSGKLRPQVMPPTDETLRRRADMVAVALQGFPGVHARRIVDGDSEGDASWHIGRLYLVGALTKAQRDDAKRLLQVVRRYETLLRGPAQPHALDMLAVKGEATEPDAAYERRYKRAKIDYERLWHVVMDCGHDVSKAVARALRDEDVDIALLRKGLDALANV